MLRCLILPVLFLLCVFSPLFLTTSLPAQQPAESGGAGAGAPDEKSPEDRQAALVYNTASRFYRQKNWREAAAAFGDFLQRFPRHADAPEARFARGYCLNRLEDHAGAVEALKPAAADEKSTWAGEASFYLGRSLDALARKSPPDSAARKDLFQRAADAFGRAARLQLGAAAAPPPTDGAAAEKPEDARKRRLDAAALALVSQGEALYQNGAFADCEKVLAPFFTEAHRWETSIHHPRGLYVLALAVYGQESAEAARSKTAEKPSFDRSLKVLLRLTAPDLEDSPHWEEAALFQARICHQAGKLDLAAKHYGQVAARNGPQAREAAFHRALALYEQQLGPEAAATAEAAASFRRFSRLYPKDPLAPRARYYEALIEFDARNYPEAAAKFGSLAGEAGEFSGRAGLKLGQSLLLQKNADAGGALRALDAAIRSLQREADSPGAAPAAAASLAEARYFRAEALLAQGRDSMQPAARAFEELAEDLRKGAPELAEKALYQQSRALYLAGDHRGAALAAAKYRELYPPERARFLPASLRLSAENAFRAPAGEISEEERRAAPEYYLQAARLLQEPAEARRLRYLAGASAYNVKDYEAAARILGELDDENRRQPAPGFNEPDALFFLADALAQMPRSARTASGELQPEDAERGKRAAGLFQEYLAGGEPRAHWPAALFNAGVVNEWLLDYPGARRCFEVFLKSYPKHTLAPQVRFELAGTLLSAGESEKAAAEYRRAAAASPDAVVSARAALQAALLERRLKHPAIAAEILEKLLQGGGKLRQAPEGRQILEKAAFELALCTSDAGKAGEAEERLGDFIREYPASVQQSEARIQLAHLLLNQGDAGRALDAVQPLIAAPPDAAGRDQALYLKAWCLQRQAASAKPDAGGAEQRRDDMEGAYRCLIAEHPQSALRRDAMVELGQQLFNRRELGEAARLFHTVVEETEPQTGETPAADPRLGELRAQAMLGLGFIAFQERDYGESRKLFDRVGGLTDDPSMTARALFQSARASMLDLREQEAVGKLQKLLEMEGKAREHREEALLRLGECHHRLQKYDDAEQALKRLLEEFPGGRLKMEGLFNLGFACQFKNKFAEASQAFRQVAAEAGPELAARAQYHIGECLVDQGKMREAAREFLAVVANFDGEASRDWVRRALLSAGIAYQSAGDGPAASQQYDELIQRFPETEEGKAASKRRGEIKP